jgi:hypothetical protein
MPRRQSRLYLGDLFTGLRELSVGGAQGPLIGRAHKGSMPPRRPFHSIRGTRSARTRSQCSTQSWRLSPHGTALRTPLAPMTRSTLKRMHNNPGHALDMILHSIGQWLWRNKTHARTHGNTYSVDAYARDTSWRGLLQHCGGKIRPFTNQTPVFRIKI